MTTLLNLTDYAMRGRGHRRRHDGAVDGSASSASGRARLRLGRRDAAHQHRTRRRRGCAGRADLSAARNGCAKRASIRRLGWRVPPSRRRWGRWCAACLSTPTCCTPVPAAGIAGLPLSCQPGIRAAGLLYAEIGKRSGAARVRLRLRARRRLRATQAATPGALDRNDGDDPARWPRFAATSGTISDRRHRGISGRPAAAAIRDRLAASRYQRACGLADRPVRTPRATGPARTK